MSGAHFGPAIEWTVEKLKALGVRSSADPAKVNPPGAWLQIAAARPLALDGSWEVDLNVFLCSSGSTPFEQLDELVDKLEGNLELRGDLEVVTLTLPSIAGVPAVRYPITVHTP